MADSEGRHVPPPSYGVIETMAISWHGDDRSWMGSLTDAGNWHEEWHTNRSYNLPPPVCPPYVMIRMLFVFLDEAPLCAVRASGATQRAQHSAGKAGRIGSYPPCPVGREARPSHWACHRRLRPGKVSCRYRPWGPMRPGGDDGLLGQEFQPERPCCSSRCQLWPWWPDHPVE